MSHIDEDAARYSAASPDSPFRNLFIGISRFFAALSNRSRDRMDLLKLDDRMLADIGLTREQAEKVANQLFWRI